MTLQYQLLINSALTYFPEKIIRSLDITEPKKMTYSDLLYEHLPEEYHQVHIIDFKELTPKIHTIREDKKNRWKVGNKIHHKIWLGKPYHSKQYQFAPIGKVTKIQTIEILHNVKILGNGEIVKSDTNINVVVKIDGKIYTGYGDCMRGVYPSFRELYKNDGFDGAERFVEYFNEDFKGKIIHWTSFSY